MVLLWTQRSRCISSSNAYSCIVDDWSCYLILAFQALYYMSEIMEERLSFHQRRPHLFYDCLRCKYIEVTADEIEGVNDYNYHFVPFIVQIIYTTKGRLFTLPDLTHEGKERVTEIIYDFMYKTEKETTSP